MPTDPTETQTGKSRTFGKSEIYHAKGGKNEKKDEKMIQRTEKKIHSEAASKFHK